MGGESGERSGGQLGGVRTNMQQDNEVAPGNRLVLGSSPLSLCSPDSLLLAYGGTYAPGAVHVGVL